MSCLYAYKVGEQVRCSNDSILRITKKLKCRHVRRPYQCILYQRREKPWERLYRSATNLVADVKSAVIALFSSTER